MHIDPTKALAVIIFGAALGHSPAARADGWVVVNAAEACNGMRAGDKSSTPEFNNDAVIQGDPTDAQRFWCRIDVPHNMYISDANVYGKDTTGAAWVTMDLRRSAYDTRVSTSISNWISTTNQMTWDAPAALCHQVEKTGYGYWLYVYIPAVANNDLEFWGFDLYYQTSAC